ncbi:hypothetical protein CBL_00787 [Carabus blaptoides fortunei]
MVYCVTYYIIKSYLLCVILITNPCILVLRVKLLINKMSNGTLIVLKKNGYEGSRFIIEQDNVYKIGSSFDCHLRFNLAKDVIENVCTISTKKKGSVKIKKMSSYPVLVNDKELSSPKNLKTGDVIKIGSKIFRWDSEMTKSENTTTSQKKISSSGSIRIPVAPIRSRRRSSIMKIRKILKAENLRPWQETSEYIVSSKAETDNAKFTVSVSPVKVSSAADCSVQSDKQPKLRSSRGATNTPKTTADMRTPKVTGKARTISKIPVACTETTHSEVSNEIVKTPVIVCSPLKTSNIKAIKSASKKSASIKKSSDCIMQAKKWKISDITDDTAKSTSPELFDIVNAENEHDANVSSDTLSISNASFSKQEETPKLRNASTNKKFITNKSHTELKKSNVIEPESAEHLANENDDLMDFEDENNALEVASAKKATGRKVQNSPLNDLSDIRGVKALMKTPGRRPKTPKNDLTDIRGVKQLLDPKKPRSPKNDLSNVAGVKALLETPGRKGKTPKNDLTNVHGVKRLMNPFREPQSPENDLTKVWGFKQLLSTPKIQKSPLNDLTDVKGIRNLLKTPGREVKSPKNDLSDVRGIKRLMNPFNDPKSPENDLTEVAGVKSLFRTPKIQNSPNNDLTNVKGVKSLLKTPGRKQNSPENDLTDVRGVKQLLDPKLVKSPENDLSDIRGVKQLFKRNNMPRNDLTDVEDVRHLFVTPEKTLNQSVEEENNTTRVSSMDDIFNELKYENEPADSPLSHLRKSPMKTYERKAMSLSPMKRDADNVKFKTRYSERIIQGPSAHVQKWIEEQTVLSSNRDVANEIDKRILPVEPEVSETQSELIKQRVLRTKNLDDVENTSDADMTPRTRTRRQRMKAVEDTKTTSPLNESRHGKTEPLSVEGITKIVPEQDAPLKRRGRPKVTTNVTDIETVPSTRSRRGRGKDAAEDEVVEEVVFIQKTTRRLRNNEKTGMETVEVIQNNMIEDVNILHSLGITENEKKKNSRKRTKAETGLDTDTVENKSSKRQRKEDISLHVKFDVPDIGTPTEPKRTRRGTKKTETKTDENETKPTVRRGRNTRRKESDENENDSEIIEVPTPQITEVQIDTKLPVKRGRHTRKKEQDESEEKVEENEAQPTQKRGRNTRKKQATEIEIILVSDENVEENTVKPRRKQPTKKIVVEPDENDINAINVPARRTRAAKVIKEIEQTEDSEEDGTGKKVQRKRRSPYTESTADEKAEDKIDSSTKTKRRKANDKVVEQEDANSSTKSTRKTRVNVIKEQEEPVRKSTRTRKVKC